MARSIRIKGRAKYLLVGLVLFLLIGSWVAPAILSQFVGSSGRGFSFFRIGYVEQHKTNLTGHWLGTSSGSYNTGFLLALEGERIVVDHAFEVREGSVSLSLRHYDWTISRDSRWSEWIRENRSGVFTIEVPATGLYDLRLSFFAFAGSVVLDWHVE